MLFHSLPFLLFVAVVLLVYHGALADLGTRKAWLLAASWFFYATWSPPYLLLLVFTTAANFAIARAIHRAPPDETTTHASGAISPRRRLLLLGIAANLVPLLVFKYARFFWSELAALAPIPGPPGLLHFAAPIGI